jgi:hypothetical protein
MICEKCKIDRGDKDFINNNKLCYRCEYQKKLKKTPKIQDIHKPMFCRICKKQIDHKEDLKKRQRTVFCSLECAQKGQKELNNNYWTRKLSSPKIAYFHFDYP